MRYYDLLFDSCVVNEALEKRLGFERMFLLNKDQKTICVDSNKARLAKAVQMNMPAVAVTDFSIDRDLISRIKENDTILCMPFYPILTRSGLDRSRLLYKAKSFLAYAYNKRIRVSFASLAQSNRFINSKMQLVELAKLIGATEEQARQGVGIHNKAIGDLYESEA